MMSLPKVLQLSTPHVPNLMEVGVRQIRRRALTLQEVVKGPERERSQPYLSLRQGQVAANANKTGYT